MTNLAKVPPELFSHVLESAPVDDILNFCEAFPDYGWICHDEVFWRHRAELDFSASSDEFNKGKGTPLDRYFRSSGVRPYRGCDNDRPIEECFVMAIEYNRFDLIDELVASHPELKLFMAAYYNIVTETKRLLDEGIDLYYGVYAFFLSSAPQRVSHYSLGNVLHTDPFKSTDLRQFLEQVIKDGNIFFISRMNKERLLRNGLSYQFQNGISDAARNGDVETINALLDTGLLYKESLYNGLSAAIQENQMSSIERLLQLISEGDLQWERVVDDPDVDVRRTGLELC